MTIAPFLRMLPILVVILSGYVMGRCCRFKKRFATVAADTATLLFISMATTDLDLFIPDRLA